MGVSHWRGENAAVYGAWGGEVLDLKYHVRVKEKTQTSQAHDPANGEDHRCNKRHSIRALGYVGVRSFPTLRLA